MNLQGKSCRGFCRVRSLEQLQALKSQTMHTILQSPSASCPGLRLNPFGLARELDSKAQSFVSSNRLRSNKHLDFLHGAHRAHTISCIMFPAPEDT